MKILNFFLLLSFMVFLTMCKPETPIIDVPILPTEPAKPEFSLKFLNLTQSPLPKEFFITKMLFDSKDKLWIATYAQGLYAFDTQTKTWQKFDFTSTSTGSSEKFTIETMDIDARDNIYMLNRTLASNRFYKFDGINQALTIDSVLAKQLYMLKVDKTSDKVWIATENGVFEVKNGIKRLYNNPELMFRSRSFTQLFDMAVDSNGKLWVGGDDYLASFDNTTWQRFEVNRLANSANNNMNVCVGKDNKIWSGVGSYFFSFDGNNVVNNLSDSLSKRNFSFPTANISPYSGNIFLSNFYNSLLYVNPIANTFKEVNRKNSNYPLGADYSIKTAFDSKGAVWVGGTNFIGELPADIR